MLADVGMVKTYSKSVHVNDLGFAWTGPPCCMDRLPPPPPPPPPLCMDQRSSLFLQFFHQVVLPCLQVHTAPSLHLPLFLEETFLHTLVSPLFMECKLHMGQSNFKASKQQWHQKGIAWTGPPCCMDPTDPPLFAWTGPPCCMDRLPPPPLCMDRRSFLFLQFFRQVVLPYLAGTHCTIPTQGAAP